jgi:hypothetical protein
MQTLTILADKDDESVVRQLKSLLSENPSIESIEVQGLDGEERLDPVTIAIIITGIFVGTGVVTKVFDWWRARSDCLLVIDARGDDLVIQPRCDLAGYKGMTIIVADSKTQITLRREEGAISADDIIKAIKAGMPAVEQLASSAGSDAITIEPLQKSIAAHLEL